MNKIIINFRLKLLYQIDIYVKEFHTIKFKIEKILRHHDFP